MSGRQPARDEDLLADPLPTMARTLEHLGIAVPAVVIEPVVSDDTAAISRTARSAALVI